MSKKGDIQLVNFFIFNSLFGPKEGEEHKKILYYHPPSVDIDSKIKHVGLCEAVAKFTQTFTDDCCESIHTQKTRQLLYQPEEHFWMVMTVSVPTTQKTKDGQTFTEYHEDRIHNSVYQAVLRQAYTMFKLFNGTITSIMQKGSVSGLKQRLEFFFTKYLITLRLGQADIMDIFCGIHFLPLDKNTYLRIQCFINLLEAIFPDIEYTAFLYNDQLVWSGLEQEDMRTLYRYLTTTLFPACLEQELKGATPTSTSSGRFLLGSRQLGEETRLNKIPQVFVDRETRCCHLLAYRSLSATVCLLLQGGLKLSVDYLKKLDQFLTSHMLTLASDISEQYPQKPSSGDTQFKYVYFNHMNLAQKTTVHTEGRKPSGVTVSPDVLRILADLSEDLNCSLAVEDGEAIVKTFSDCWVVGKKSDQREFYVVLNQKNANLIEINDEVKKLCSSQFSGIFFLE